jgi:hypothetical protein
VDLLIKKHNRVQSELPSDTTMNEQWTRVSYYHQKTRSHQKSLKTTERILPQHIPETAKRFEILTSQLISQNRKQWPRLFSRYKSIKRRSPTKEFRS